jgi:hypothetical protein
MREAAIILVILILLGCGKNDGPSVDAYKKGTDGLQLTFLKGAPPDKLYEDSGFTVGIQVKNKGAYDIKDGELVLNLETDYMEATNAKTPINLAGRSLYNPGGAFDMVQYDAQTRLIDAQSMKHTSQVIATACYEYYAETSQNVCIDADYSSIRPGKKVCEVKDLTLTDQGGPVAITKIEQRMVPRDGGTVQASFIIHIQNKGTGTPVNMLNTKAACGVNTDKDLTYWNYVHLKTIQLSDNFYQFYNKDSTSGNMVCSPNPVKLEKGIGQIRCTTPDLSPGSSYIAPLNVILAYGYTESISKPVIIERQI